MPNVELLFQAEQKLRWAARQFKTNRQQPKEAYEKLFDRGVRSRGFGRMCAGEQSWRHE
jgi:hypothetical protein